MNKALLFSVVLILFFRIALIAQTDLASFDLRIKNPQDAYATSDTMGSTAFVFQGNKQYFLTILNSRYEVEKNIIYNRTGPDKKDKIIGGTINDNSFIIYLYNKKTHVVSSITGDRKAGTSVYNKIAQLSPIDQYLKGFPMDGKFYLLTIPKHLNILKVFSSADGIKFEETSYNIEMPSFYANLNSNLSAINDEIESAVSIKEIKYDLENNTKSGHVNKKLYHEKGKIYITVDDANTTHLITINDRTKKSSYQKLNFNLEKGNHSKQKQGNSFYFNSILFRASISPEQLNLSMINLDSMKLINTYNIYPDNEIEILNGPIIQEGSSNTFGADEKIIKKPSIWFKRVMNGDLAIVANKIDSNRYEVELGSYEEFNTRGGGGFSPGFSMGVGIGFGMGMGMGGFGGYPYYSPYVFGYPGYGFGYPGYSPYSNSGTTRIRVAYFKTILNATDFKHMDGNIPMTVREKVIEYQQNTRGTSELQVLIPYNASTVLFGYYVKGKNKFKVVEFKKNSSGPTRSN